MTTKTARHLLGCGLLALAVAALPDRPLNAWGASGHRVVARIAWERHDAGGPLRARMTCWSRGGADAFYRCGHVGRRSPIGAARHLQLALRRYQGAVRCVRAGPGLPADRSRRLRDCRARALARHGGRCGAARGGARTEALKFIIHFVGDLHQPLHATDNHDRGGNDVRVLPLRAEDGRNTNLHAVWDTGLINLSTETEPARAGRLLSGVQARPVDVLGLNVERWVLESNRVGRQAVYAYPSFNVGDDGRRAHRAR